MSAERRRARARRRSRVASQRGPSTSAAPDDGERGAGGQAQVGAVDEQQAAEQQPVDARLRAEHVAGEDDAERQRRGEGQRRHAVGLRAAPPREHRDERRPSTSAAPKAPSAAEKPRPSASTRPGNVAVPTACAKNASPRRTIQVPSTPAATARSRTSATPRWKNGSANGSEHRAEASRE